MEVLNFISVKHLEVARYFDFFHLVVRACNNQGMLLLELTCNRVVQLLPVYKFTVLVPQGTVWVTFLDLILLIFESRNH